MTGFITWGYVRIEGKTYLVLKHWYNRRGQEILECYIYGLVVYDIAVLIFTVVVFDMCVALCLGKFSLNCGERKIKQITKNEKIIFCYVKRYALSANKLKFVSLCLEWSKIYCISCWNLFSMLIIGKNSRACILYTIKLVIWFQISIFWQYFAQPRDYSCQKLKIFNNDFKREMLSMQPRKILTWHRWLEVTRSPKPSLWMESWEGVKSQVSPKIVIQRRRSPVTFAQ